MKVKGLIVSLLNEELQGKPRLLRVDIPIAQGEVWNWILLSFEDLDEAGNIQELSIRLLELLSPIQAGEIFGHSNQLSVYYAISDFIPEKTSIDILFQPPIGDNIPCYVRDALSSEENLSNFFFLRIKKQVNILDADYLVRKIREETWFRARTVPYHLSYRKVEIIVGAQRKTIVPEKQPPILCFEWDKGYYAAFYNPNPERSVKYNLYCYDGKLETLTCNRDEFLTGIKFPLGEIYGFDLMIPLEFDTFLSSAKNTEYSLLSAIQHSSEARQRIFEVVREQLYKIKQQTVERLEERRRHLLNRKSVLLQSNGKEMMLGFEPTNENELIILATKLEDAISKQLSYFKIIEHTGQLGIDGLIQIKRTPGSMFEEAASVEFEYELANFFKHGHPILQTNYIICWTIGDLQDGTLHIGKGGIRPNGSLVAELRSSDWMKILIFSNHIIHVLPIDRFPGIILKNN